MLLCLKGSLRRCFFWLVFVTSWLEALLTHRRILLIPQLEISLAKKDEQLAAKDQRILELQSAPLFRENNIVGGGTAKTPGATERKHSSMVSLTPNQVSDDSGELEDSRSLSHISKINSSDDDGSPSDGRWNIPFDPSTSFDDDTNTKSPRNALKDIAFVPIGSQSRESGEGRRHSGGGARITQIVRPVARRSFGGVPVHEYSLARGDILVTAKGDKENVMSPKARNSIGGLSSTLPLRDIR